MMFPLVSVTRVARGISHIPCIGRGSPIVSRQCLGYSHLMLGRRPVHYRLVLSNIIRFSLWKLCIFLVHCINSSIFWSLITVSGPLFSISICLVRFSPPVSPIISLTLWGPLYFSILVLSVAVIGAPVSVPIISNPKAVSTKRWISSPLELPRLSLVSSATVEAASVHISVTVWFPLLGLLPISHVQWSCLARRLILMLCPSGCEVIAGSLSEPFVSLWTPRLWLATS